MPDFDPYSMQLMDEPTALEMAKARAAALRGQNYAGMVMGLAHDPQAAKMGGELMQQAQTGQAQLGEMPGQRMQRLLHQQALEKGQREAAPYTDPAQSALMAQGQQQAAQMFGGSIPTGASPTTGGLLLQQMEKAASIPKYVTAGYGTTGTIDTRTGKYLPFPEGANGAIDQSVVKQQADIYKKTGVLPNMGKLNPQYHAAILKEVAGGGESGADIVTGKASFKADTGSLTTLQKSADSIESFENTALKNIKAFQQQAHQLVDTGSPFFNRPIRHFMDAFMGDPNVSKFNAFRQTAAQETGKVLGGAVAGGAITDSQRHDADSIFRGDMTVPQIDAAVAAMEQDMGNRKTAVHAQIDAVKGRMRDKPAAPEAAAAGPAAPAAKPDVRARIAQLKASGASADALRQQLKSEYTPDELKAAVGGGR